MIMEEAIWRTPQLYEGWQTRGRWETARHGAHRFRQLSFITP